MNNIAELVMTAFTSIFAGVLTGVAAAMGPIKEYVLEKIKQDYEKQMELQRQQHLEMMQIYDHQYQRLIHQFKSLSDDRFSAYKELWKMTVKMGYLIHDLDPSGIVYQKKDITPEENQKLWEERVNRLLKHHHEFVEYSDMNAIIFSSRTNAACREVAKLTYTHLNDKMTQMVYGDWMRDKPEILNERIKAFRDRTEELKSQIMLDIGNQAELNKEPVLPGVPIVTKPSSLKLVSPKSGSNDS